MIELTFKGNSLAEVFKNMKAALAGEVESAVADSAQQTEEVVKEAVESKPSVTLSEIQSLTKAKLEEKKSAAIKKLLSEFGVSKVGQVAEDDYANFYARLEEL
ncbi:TPA: hypothetical protein U1C44_001475 [Streptococcus suis]|nr:hypothetical protein [Streptococcus suis]